MPSSIKSITIILVPYHVGIYNHRVGAGPHRILQNNLVSRLQSLGKAVTTTIIPSVDSFEGEIGRSFELIRRTSTAVSLAVQADAFSIVLAGNCNTSVGVVAGLTGRSEDFDVVWFEAHSDLASTNEMTSGYFDGSGVSMLNGESWKALLATVPGHRPLGLEKVTYCGIRDLDERQFEKLDRSKAKVVYGKLNGDTTNCTSYATRLDDELSQTARGERHDCLVHVDLDCLDSSIGKINEYAAPGGLDEKDLLECLAVVAAKRRPIALTIASFNPHLGAGDTVAEIAVNAIIDLISAL